MAAISGLYSMGLLNFVMLLGSGSRNIHMYTYIYIHMAIQGL